MRLDKFVCKSTDLSRDEATAFIQQGRVSVNGAAVLDAQTQVHENNCIALDGTRLVLRPFRYLMLHKPAGTICSNIDEAYPSLFNTMSIENAAQLHVAGRLDADTTGLVLATDDGRWSFDIIRPSQACEKHYRVTLQKTISEDARQRFAEGIQLQGESKPTRPAVFAVISPHQVLLTITEGKFHQVKRMFAAIGNRVIELHREKIGSLALDVNVGEWRDLTHDEVNALSQTHDS